jgi:hypothetical protein
VDASRDKTRTITTPPRAGRRNRTDDIQNFVRAARILHPEYCDGNIALLGGSGGGGHAAFVALDKTPTPNNAYPHWCQNGLDDRPNCAACLSGAYDMSYRLDGETLDHYVKDIESYTNVSLRDDGNPATYDQKSVSPVAKVKSKEDQEFKPLYLANSDGDSMPVQQISLMVCALAGVGIDTSDGLETTTIPDSSAHAWELWPLNDLVMHMKIRDEVIAFFDDHLKDPP